MTSESEIVEGLGDARFGLRALGFQALSLALLILFEVPLGVLQGPLKGFGVSCVGFWASSLGLRVRGLAEGSFRVLGFRGLKFGA